LDAIAPLIDVMEHQAAAFSIFSISGSNAD
jgi:hypothetical protein